jgi:hypothetical protein
VPAAISPVSIFAGQPKDQFPDRAQGVAGRGVGDATGWRDGGRGVGGASAGWCRDGPVAAACAATVGQAGVAGPREAPGRPVRTGCGGRRAGVAAPRADAATRGCRCPCPSRCAAVGAAWRPWWSDRGRQGVGARTGILAVSTADPAEVRDLTRAERPSGADQHGRICRQVQGFWGLVRCGLAPYANVVEIAVLRHWLTVLRRQADRPRYTPATVSKVPCRAANCSSLICSGGTSGPASMVAWAGIAQPAAASSEA